MLAITFQPTQTKEVGYLQGQRKEPTGGACSAEPEVTFWKIFFDIFTPTFVIIVSCYEAVHCLSVVGNRGKKVSNTFSSVIILLRRESIFQGQFPSY